MKRSLSVVPVSVGGSRRSRRSRVGGPQVVLLALFGAAGFAGCGDSDDPTLTGGSGGGGAGSGGAAGAGASGGSAGSAGTAGGGTAGTSTAGAGGSLAGAGGSAGGAGMGFDPYPPVPYPAENPATPEKEMLGKVLFWEEQLSSDNTMACGTCHRASAGGSDPRAIQDAAIHPGADGVFATGDDRRGAQGVVRCNDNAGTITYKADATFGMNVQVTGRKPPTYLDAMFARDNFWDGRASSRFIDPDNGQIAIMVGGALESQSVGPPMSDAEMACENRTWASVHAKLATAQPLGLARDVPPGMKDFIALYPTYPLMFEAAFGTQEINTKRIAFAIATHERRLTSDRTPWDRWNAGDATAMTPDQVRGFELFMNEGKCNLCHAPPLFSDAYIVSGVNEFHNLGFSTVDPTFDNGRESVTGDPNHRGAVKTPTLRNVGLREPGGLLHTGTGHGADLLAVMQAYKNPPGLSAPVDPLLTPLPDVTGEDINLIIDFMRNGLTDPRVRAEAPPFDRPKLSTEP